MAVYFDLIGNFGESLLFAWQQLPKWITIPLSLAQGLHQQKRHTVS